MVDKHAAHQLRGGAKEMRPILPVVVMVRDEAQIRLIDQGGWLQHVSGRLAPKMRSREKPQLRVDERHQVGKRVTATRVYPLEQGRDVTVIPLGIRVAS